MSKLKALENKCLKTCSLFESDGKNLLVVGCFQKHPNRFKNVRFLVYFSVSQTM